MAKQAMSCTGQQPFHLNLPLTGINAACLQVQKLALLLEVDMQQDRVMELVPPIAIAARRNLLQLKDMPALLWGFAGATRLPCTTPPC